LNHHPCSPLILNWAFGSDVPTHRANQTRADRKPKTGARGPAVGARDTIELVEDFAEGVRRNADPIVGDGQCNGVAYAMRGDARGGL
jgi:hypothetical protein